MLLDHPAEHILALLNHPTEHMLELLNHPREHILRYASTHRLPQPCVTQSHSIFNSNKQYIPANVDGGVTPARMLAHELEELGGIARAPPEYA